MTFDRMLTFEVVRRREGLVADSAGAAKRIWEANPCAGERETDRETERKADRQRARERK